MDQVNKLVWIGVRGLVSTQSGRGKGISIAFAIRSFDRRWCVQRLVRSAHPTRWQFGIVLSYKVELRACLNNRWQSNFGHFGRGFFMLLWSPAIHLSGFLSHSLFARLIPRWGFQRLVGSLSRSLFIRLIAVRILQDGNLELYFRTKSSLGPVGNDIRGPKDSQTRLEGDDVRRFRGGFGFRTLSRFTFTFGQ